MARESVQYLGIIRRAIARTFNLDELHTIAFDLGLNWDELPGETITSKTRSLIAYLSQRGFLTELLNILREERPKVEWPDVPSSEQQIIDIRDINPKPIELGSIIGHRAQIVQAGNVQGSIIQAQGDIVLGKSMRDEQYDAAINWDGKRRLRGFDLSGRDLSEAELSTADLRKSNFNKANLQSANLHQTQLEEANMEWANLRRANLAGASIYKANLKKACLVNADLRRSGMVEVNLQRADLQEANLEGAYLDAASMEGASLWASNMRGSSLIGAYLQGVNLRAANLEKANLDVALLYGADMSHANLEGAWHLTNDQLAQTARLRHAIMPDGTRYNGCFNLEADTRDAQAEGIDVKKPVALAGWYGVALGSYEQGQEQPQYNVSKNRLIGQLHSRDKELRLLAVEDLRSREWLSDGTLRGAQLDGVSLRRLDLSGSDLSSAVLLGANLKDINLKEAKLENAWLVGANLTRANLKSANLQNALLMNTHMQNTNFENADLSGAGLIAANLLNAILDGANLTEARLGIPGSDENPTVLHGTSLEGAILQRTWLLGVDLQGTRKLTDKQLAQAQVLWRATMPDGSRYDGRYNLPGDIKAAIAHEFEPDDAEEMADWYGVSIELYQRGQEWARRNLPMLRPKETKKDHNSND